MVRRRVVAGLTRRATLRLLALAAGAGIIQLGASSASASGEWQRHPSNPILSPGFEVWPGGPRALAIADPSVMFDDDDQIWKMWFACLWQDNGARLGIKYADSRDGVSWAVQDGLAFSPPDDSSAWDATQVETPSVLKLASAPPDQRYALYYAGGNVNEQRLGGGYPFFQVGLAYSADGRQFTRLPGDGSPYGLPGLVLHGRDMLPGAADGLIADPEVKLNEGVLHMWTTSLGFDTSHRPIQSGISHATSADGIKWIPSANNPLPTLHRSIDGVAGQPSVVWNDALQGWEMWFTDDSTLDALRVWGQQSATVGFWYAFSTDGLTWSRAPRAQRNFEWSAGLRSESRGLITGVAVVLVGDQYRMYYSAYTDDPAPGNLIIPNAWNLNLATLAVNSGRGRADAMRGDP